MRDLGYEPPKKPQLYSDSSAAIGIADRLGTGKVRHIEVCQLWVQDMVASGKVDINKTGTQLNLAEALTKYVDSSTMEYHIAQTGGHVRQDRHRDAPKVEDSKENPRRLRRNERNRRRNLSSEYIL